MPRIMTRFSGLSAAHAHPATEPGQALRRILVMSLASGNANGLNQDSGPCRARPAGPGYHASAFIVNQWEVAIKLRLGEIVDSEYTSLACTSWSLSSTTSRRSTPAFRLMIPGPSGF